MLRNYTARYIRTSSGYMGQLIEWPEVISEGRMLEGARESLRDALREMVKAYRQLKRKVPIGGGLIEQLPVEV